jgi:peptidase E
MLPNNVGCVGSGEFEAWTAEVDRYLLDAATGDGSVLILPTASAPDGDMTFQSWARKGLRHYETLGIPARVSGLVSRSDAYTQSLIAELERPSMIYLSGGKPDYLASTLLGTPAWSAIRASAERGAAIVGCSAGMCLLGGLAPSNVTARPHDITWVDGSRLLGDLLLVPHWNILDDHAPGCRAQLLDGFAGGRSVIGVTERTAIATTKGAPWRVFGEGYVFLRRFNVAETFGQGDTFEIDGRPSAERVLLYHRTSEHEASMILSEGFVDGPMQPSLAGIARSGVWLSDRPDVGVPGAHGNVTLAIDLDAKTVDRYRLPTPGQEFCEICIPSHVLNGFPLVDPEPSPSEEDLRLVT